MNDSLKQQCDGRPRRVHKPPEVRRREILDAAARVFSECGYRQTDMQEVADRAAVGKGTVYRHFPTKQVLFMAALEQNLDRLSCFVEQAREQHAGDPAQALRATVRAYLDFFDQHPETVELFVQERAELRTGDKPLYFVRSEGYRTEWQAWFASLIEQLTGGRGIPTMTPQQAMEMLGFMLYGAVMTTRLEGGTTRPSDHAEPIINTFLHGVLHEPD